MKFTKQCFDVLKHLCSDNTKEYHLKEIAIVIESKKSIWGDRVDSPRLPIYMYYVQKLIELGLVTSEKRMYKNHMTTFYKATKPTLPKSVEIVSEFNIVNSNFTN